MPQEKKPYLLSSVNNALKILDILSVRDDIGVAEISRLAKIDKSSAFKILYTLEHRDYVIKTTGAHYRLGVKFTNYGNLVAERQTLADVAAPTLCHLRDECGETVCLGVLNTNGRVIVTYLAESTAAKHVASRIGYEMDAYNNANGKLLLANLPQATQLDILKKLKLTPRTPHTITSKPILQDQLDRLRGEPLVEQYEEYYPGHCDLAAPVLDAQGSYIGAISIACAPHRMRQERERFGALLLDAARGLCHKMGYYGEL